MIFHAVFFDELSAREIYEILKARAEIFVVEQKCLYQDMDDVDYRALHAFYEEEGKVLAYFRAFRDGDAVKIGRVLTLRHGEGSGAKLMERGIAAVCEKMKPSKLVVDAQCHAIGFYEKSGFAVTSGVFYEVGIPHVRMEKNV